jgi:uncharacterized membrane protein YphA (DoxX/SURF4 family)
MFYTDAILEERAFLMLLIYPKGVIMVVPINTMYNKVIAFMDEKGSEWMTVFVRILFGGLWLQGASWKMPPDFGLALHQNLYYWVSRAVEFPVFPPFSWFVAHVVLPHFLLFAWPLYLIEITLGVVFVLGLRVRFFSIIALLMTINIGLSVLNTPGEWPWSYVLMGIVSVLLFAHPYTNTRFSLEYWIKRRRTSTHT